jgi:hypothetical protein
LFADRWLLVEGLGSEPIAHPDDPWQIDRSREAVTLHLKGKEGADVVRCAKS